jgi:hypothetical protein
MIASAEVNKVRVGRCGRQCHVLLLAVLLSECYAKKQSDLLAIAAILVATASTNCMVLLKPLAPMEPLSAVAQQHRSTADAQGVHM